MSLKSINIVCAFNIIQISKSFNKKKKQIVKTPAIYRFKNTARRETFRPNKRTCPGEIKGRTAALRKTREKIRLFLYLVRHAGPFAWHKIPEEEVFVTRYIHSSKEYEINHFNFTYWRRTTSAAESERAAPYPDVGRWVSAARTSGGDSDS
jgi:hypothetical protein